MIKKVLRKQIILFNFVIWQIIAIQKSKMEKKIKVRQLKNKMMIRIIFFQKYWMSMFQKGKEQWILKVFKEIKNIIKII